MSTNQQRDADVDRLLRGALKPAADADAGECPEASLLAAFVEGGLSKEEQATLDAHIVQCGRCQDVLAIIGREGPLPDAEPIRSGWFTWVSKPRLRWLVPITALATVAVFFFATRPLIAPGDSAASREATQMAQATPPAEPVSPAAGMPEAVPAPSTVATAPAKRAAGGGSMDKLKSTQPAGKIPEREQRPAREVRPSDQAAAPLEMAQAAPPPAAAPAPSVVPPSGQAAPERKDVVEFAARPAAAPRAADADESRQGAVSLQKGAELRSNEAAFVVIAVPGSAVRWRLAAGGRIWRSTDAGGTWQAQATGVSAALVAGSAPSPRTCWVVGAGGTVLLTVDGEHWERRPFPSSIDLAGVRATDARSATVTTRDGRRFQTTDAGLTWK